MKNTLYDHGYNSKWTDVYVAKHDRYHTSVTDFHEHDFYEINLILSGNVKALAANQTVEGTDCKIVLAKPNTPHFVSCKSDVLYRSLYLMFSEKFIESFDIQAMNLLSVFGERGAILTITPTEKDKCAEILELIAEEKSLIRKRFLVFYLLSYIKDLSTYHNTNIKTIPAPVYEVVTYINKHYSEKLTAKELADTVHIGRTTLMTQFKKYTEKTLHEYIVNCRLKNAIKLLLQGKTEYEAAVSCGFSDSSSFIQCFKKTMKMTPKQYISSN